MNKKDIHWPADFSVLHNLMRKFLLTRGNGTEELRNKELLTFNPKGDRQYSFDKEIDDLIFNRQKEHFREQGPHEGEVRPSSTTIKEAPLKNYQIHLQDH